MLKPQIQDIEELIDQLPPLSPAISGILRLANDMTASPKDLVDIIKLDPVLAGKILKIINSAFFGLSSPVATLSKALILMGFNTIKNIALTSAMLNTVKAGDGQDLSEALWEHCLGTAVASRILAKELGEPINRLDEYFIAGLLHDIGRVLWVQQEADHYGQALKACQEQPGLSILDAETEVFGLDHCQLGDMIAQKWNLPPVVRQSITWHHQLVDEKVVYVVHLADRYCKKNGIGLDVDGDCEMNQEALKSLGITQEAIDQIMVDLSTNIEDSRMLLDS